MGDDNKRWLIHEIKITIPEDGTYYIEVSGNVQPYNSQTNKFPRLGIFKNNNIDNRLVYAAISFIGTGNQQQTFYASTKVELKAGDVLEFGGNGICQVFEGCRMTARRVG